MSSASPAPPASGARRPIAARGSGWARALAAALTRSGLTPNAISQAGLAAAVLAGLCLGLHAEAGGGFRPALLAGGAVLIVLRLLCNLLDGMVAVEGGRAAPDGAFWNEVPDRVADVAVIAGAGYGAGVPELGWAAAALAVGTAYVRAFGQALGQPADFGGPMAKPHRMWLLAAAALAAAAGAEAALPLALAAVAAGSALTCLLRAARLRRALLARPDP